MEYVVIGKIMRQKLYLISNERYYTPYHSKINIDKFNFNNYFYLRKAEFEEQYRKDSIIKDNSMNNFYYGISLCAENLFEKWKFINKIKISDGELRKQDKYQIDGKEYTFDICYNQDLCRMEIRLDYVIETIEDETNKRVKEKYEEFQKLLDDYNKELELKEKIKKEILEKEKHEIISVKKKPIKKWYQFWL